MSKVINPISESIDLNFPNDVALVICLLYRYAEHNTAVLTATINYIHKSTCFDLR